MPSEAPDLVDPRARSALRYVLLRHECRPDHRDGPHWDLMLEDGDTLRTWSLPELPVAWGNAEGAESVAATPLPPHRRRYLDYEGEVRGGRGTVHRVAAGEFRWLRDEPARVRVEALSGALRGLWAFERRGDAGWRLTVR